MFTTCVWQSKFAKRVNDQLFNIMDVGGSICGTTLSMFGVQVQKRISDQLSWPVIGDVSAAMNSNELCTN